MVKGDVWTQGRQKGGNSCWCEKEVNFLREGIRGREMGKGVRGVGEGSNRCWCEKEANCLRERIRTREIEDDGSESVWGIVLMSCWKAVLV